MLSIEQAIYYKYLLICGYTDEFEQYIIAVLDEEDPVSDITLKLTSCGPDLKQMLTVLNAFISNVPEEQIDYNKVFGLVLTFLRSQYSQEKMTMENLTDLMYRISVLTEKDMENPWATMNVIGELYSEACTGYISMDSYMDAFEKFINEGICMQFHNIRTTQRGRPFLRVSL